MHMKYKGGLNAIKHYLSVNLQVLQKYFAAGARTRFWTRTNKNDANTR